MEQDTGNITVTQNAGEDAEFSKFEQFCGSKFWDLNLTWYTDHPAFTDCFQKTLLVWTPCAFLWAFASVEIGYLFLSKNRVIPLSLLNILKTLFSVCLVLLSIAEFIVAMNYSKKGEYNVHDVDVYTPVVKAATFVLVTALVICNKKYGIRTSIIQFLFWLLCAICGLPQLFTEIERIEWKTNPVNGTFVNKTEEIKNVTAAESTENMGPLHLEYLSRSYTLYYSLVLLLFVCSWFPDGKPKHTTYSKDLKQCPEESSGAMSRLWFFWVDVLLFKGNRKAKVEYSDLWDMKPEDTAQEIIPRFEYHWNKAKKLHPEQKNGYAKATYTNGSPNITLEEGKGEKAKKKRVSVFPSLVKTFARNMLLDSLLKLICDTLIFANPQLLKYLIRFVEEKDEHVWKGYFYAFSIFAVGTFYTVTCANFTRRLFTCGMRAKSLLIGIIYRKALRLTNTAKRQSTVGEIVNLMAVDTQKCIEMMYFIHMSWSVPMQLLIALYFLYDLLGWPVFVGFSVMAVMIPVNGYITNLSRKLQAKQMKIKDERVKMMNEVLNGMKVLKLYAWEPSFEQLVLGIREKELKVIKKAVYLNAITSFIWISTPFLVAIVTFVTYVLSDENNVLDASKAFVAIALFGILQHPLTALPRMITTFIHAYVSVERINNFMNSDDLEPDNVTSYPNEYTISVKHGAFDWGEDFSLRNIVLKCPKKSLTAIVGPIGCGKSSLLSALLGEMEKRSGTVNVIGTVAYVSQHAWIQNATLEDNILFGQPMNRKLYDIVIDACALRQDLEILPAGDQTEIGEKGINLSGGQKQRISLARAVYSNSDVYYLDDPLSAVDSHVGKHIFQEVIGPTGLLKSKTRVFVTNAITHLSKMDQIVVLENGEISEMGTYEVLMGKNGAFSEFIKNHQNEKEEGNYEAAAATTTSNNDLSDAAIKRNLSSQSFRPTFDRSVSKISDGIPEPVNLTNGLKHRNSKQHTIPEDGAGDLIEEEKTMQGKVKWSVYKHYLSSIGMKFAVLTVFAKSMTAGFSMGSNICLSYWSTDPEANSSDHSVRNFYLILYSALGILQSFATIFGTLAPYLGCWYASRSLHTKILQCVLRCPLAFFETTPLGRILARFSKDIDDIDSRLPMLLAMTLNTVMQVLSTLIIVTYTTPIFIAVVIPIGVIYVVIQKFYIKTSRQVKRLDSVTRSPIYSHFSETISGATTIRAFGKQEKFITESDNKINTNQVYHYAGICANQWLAIRLETIGNCIMLFAALSAVMIKDQNAGLVGLSISYALHVTHALNWLIRCVAEVEITIVSVERVKEYSDLSPEAPWDIPGREPSQMWPDNGTVTFKNYSLRYREGLDLVLKRINLSISGGEKVGIVGRTGAGKSTLTLALFRILESAEGDITIDGQKTKLLGLHTLRSRLTIIPQDNVLFSGSLRLNLDPFNRHTDEELWKALKNAHLSNFVKDLPAGLNHEIAEGGDNLSAGQRQLVCLARALLRKTKILVLDEATASVDLETDDLIQQTISREFKDCTVITIAHRLNTIMDSDRILVLDKGEISEFDSPQNLLKNSSSLFYGLCKDAGLV